MQSLLEIVIDNMRQELQIKNMSILNYEVLWLYFFTGTTELQLGDLKNPKALVQELKFSKNGLLSKMKQNFSKELIQTPDAVWIGKLTSHILNNNINYQKSKIVFNELRPIYVRSAEIN